MKWIALAANLIWFSGTAQTVKVQLDAITDHGALYAVCDTQRLTYFIKDPKSIHVLTFDNALKVCGTGDFDLRDFIKPTSGVIALSEINKLPTIFFADSKLRSFYYIALNTDGLSISKRKFLELPKTDNYLGCFAGGNSLYILLLRNTGTYKLVIGEFTLGQEIKYHEINLNDIPFSYAEGHGPYSLFFTGYQDVTMLKKINVDNENTNYTGRALSKFYPDHDKLSFTFNTIADTSQILTVDLHTFKASLVKIPSGVPVCLKDNSINDNSFLLGNKLLYVSACKNYLVFKIFDAGTGSALKEFITDKAGLITYMQGGLIEEDDVHLFAKEKADEPSPSTKEILNKLRSLNDSKQMGLGAFINSDSLLEVTIGSSEDGGGIYYWPFMNPFWMGINPGFAPPVMTAPAYHGGFHLLFPALEWNENYLLRPQNIINKYFRAYFDTKTFEPVHTKSRVSTQQQIQEKVKSMKKEEYSGGANGIKFNDKVILSYIQTNLKLFTLSVLKTAE